MYWVGGVNELLTLYSWENVWWWLTCGKIKNKKIQSSHKTQTLKDSNNAYLFLRGHNSKQIFGEIPLSNHKIFHAPNKL